MLIIVGIISETLQVLMTGRAVGFHLHCKVKRPCLQPVASADEV